MKSVSLIFEMLNGCGMGCAGCRIQKDDDLGPSVDQILHLHGLFKDLKTLGVELKEIEIAPTDILSAGNTWSLLQNDHLLEFLNEFSLLSISASMVHADQSRYQELATALKNLKVSEKLRLIIPIEMNHVFNDKYLQRIKNNLEVVNTALPNGIYSTALNVIFDEAFVKNPLKKFSYDELFSRVNDLVIQPDFEKFNTRVDFVFHHGRVPFTDDSQRALYLNKSFLKSLVELNHHYHRDYQKRHGIKAGEVPAFVKFDVEHEELVYHQGKLYVRPIINDRATVFDQKLLYAKPWSAQGLQEHLTSRFNDNLIKGVEFEDCSNCPHLPQCAARYTQDLMQIAGTQQCITFLKDYS